MSVSNEIHAQQALISRAVHDTTMLETKQKIAEQNLRYSKSILTKDFDFQLTPVSEGKFAINFAPNTKDIVSIRIYDIIGNVLYEEEVNVRGNASRQIDLSMLKTNFFIVEIKNEQYNKTKSIVTS